MSRKGGFSKRSILISTLPDTQKHKIIDNWNDYRVLGVDELHVVGVGRKDVDTGLIPRVDEDSEVGSVELSAASTLDCH